MASADFGYYAFIGLLQIKNINERICQGFHKITYSGVSRL